MNLIQWEDSQKNGLEVQDDFITNSNIEHMFSNQDTLMHILFEGVRQHNIKKIFVHKKRVRIMAGSRLESGPCILSSAKFRPFVKKRIEEIAKKTKTYRTD